jgi:hypothetical protein
MLDRERVIAEVAARNGIRIESDDPIFAVTTMTQLGLEESAQKLQDKLLGIIAEFEANVRGVERCAGKVLAQEVRDCAGEMRRELQNDITAAGMKARELVYRIHEAHQRPNLIVWASIGLLCGLALFSGGVWFGRLTAGP